MPQNGMREISISVSPAAWARRSWRLPSRSVRPHGLPFARIAGQRHPAWDRYRPPGPVTTAPGVVSQGTGS